jgi:hypothetical protein
MERSARAAGAYVASCRPADAEGLDGSIDRTAELGRVSVERLKRVWSEQHDQASVSTAYDAGVAAVAHGDYVVPSLIEVEVEGHPKWPRRRRTHGAVAAGRG